MSEVALRKLDTDKIADLECGNCGRKIMCRYYTQDFGVELFNYTHVCVINLTIEQLDRLESK